MFGFPKADRTEIRLFKRNYLKSVILQIKYPLNDLIIEKREEILVLFKDLFPRTQENSLPSFELSLKSDLTPILQPISDKNIGFQLKSQDGQSVLSFSKDSISYTIAGKAYESFEKVVENFKLINSVISLCKIESITRVAIRKLNIIEIEIPRTIEQSKMEIMGIVLNPKLIANVSYIPDLKYIQQSIQTTTFVKENDRLNLRYGLVIPQMESNLGQILVDIDMFKIGDFKTKNLFDLLPIINDGVFDVFNWAVAKETINHLKK